MTRKITIEVASDLNPEEYADLANAIWMMMRNTPWEFHIEHDGKTDAATLNGAWDQYGSDARWT